MIHPSPLSKSLEGIDPNLMHTEISDPMLIAESSFVNEPGVERWGYYQFPQLSRLLDGRIAVTFHINADSASAYGKAAIEPNRGVSSDGGKTWERIGSGDPEAGLLLPNGERLLVANPAVTPVAHAISSYDLPPERGTVIGTYGQQPYVCYRHDELPSELQGVPSARMSVGATIWIKERARLDDPQLLRFSTEGVFPVTCWGDVHVTPDKALLAVVYPSRIEGHSFRQMHTVCYRSEDNGLSWQAQGRMLYQPYRTADPLSDKRDGFTEPTCVLLPDGEMVVVMRTTDGNGDGPLYLSRSENEGRDWSTPKVIRNNGALPRLLRLGNGVLVMSSGRPGADMSFSLDGRGEEWTERYPLVPITSDYTQHDSCGYTSMLALDDDSFLITYSWFRKPSSDGQTRKAILVRHVKVSV